MTRQLISTNRQLLLRHVTRSVRHAAGFVQVRFEDIASELLESRLWTVRATWCPVARPVLALATMDHCSLAYSDFAAIRMGMSGSASFQRVRKS